ncbi:unnamed protein product, partial [Thlaspi arvense]
LLTPNPSPRMSEAKIEETVCEDRISALPEDLLAVILLLLPIKDAVVTMILSKRWRFIWTMLPRLEYKENRDGDDCFLDKYNESDDVDESKKSIWWFFEKSMELHKAPVLAALLLKLGPGCPSDADVGKWLAKAVDRRVAVLKFKLCWSASPIRLPKSLYTCETLEELTLSHKILVHLPSSCCLPSLLVLHLLHVVYKDEASLVSFLSSCPVLEVLSVTRNKDDNVTNFSVKVPSLLYLWYDNYGSITPLSLSYDKDVVDTGRCLAIDTPALVDFRIIDYSGDSCSTEMMPCLEYANIDVRSFPDIDNPKTTLSAVLSLELFMSNQVLVRCTTINFSRLIKLIIFPHRLDWLKPLLLLLENAPKLKDFLEYTFIPRERIPLSWNQPSSVPGCLSSQLERFEFREYGNRKEEKEFFKYILATSKCLKTATLSLRPSWFDREEQELIMEELKGIPRVSTTSQLLIQ